MKNKIEMFMRAAGQLPPFDERRQVMLYTGLQLEEMAEKLGALGLHQLASELDRMATLVKKGQFDDLYRPNYVECLDADIDIVWVSLSSSLIQGSDVDGAFEEIGLSNYPGKLWPDGTIHKNEFGKVVKPTNWKAPNLLPFVKKDV